MRHQQFLMSICIPTFNRASLLHKTLESITIQDAFAQTTDIEIIISDNCSDDDTQSVIASFTDAFPDKIRSYRPIEAVSADLNFEFVMAKGTGTYLKLHNDNLTIRDGSLAEIIKVLRATASEKPIIFFANGNMRRDNPIEVVSNINDFVRRVSYFSTWIGGFGMWRGEFLAMSDITRNAHMRLIQTDILFRLLASGKRAIILYEQYFIGLDVGRKGGYNIAEVFGKNYLQILKWYLGPGMLDEEVFQLEKKALLHNHIIPYYFDLNNDFQKTGFFPFMQDYLQDDYFYQAIENLVLAPNTSAQQTKSQVKAIDHSKNLAAHWRTLNAHNETTLVTGHGPFDFNHIKVGRRSYGGLIFWTFGKMDERLTIGSFVSIADDVKFLLGGNHPTEGFSTFPFKAKYFNTMEAITKGPVIVCDDVWIGYDSTILSGVTIGQGAVVAAGSIVTKDVPPYSIVGGNPARVIKYRFSPEVIDKMLTLDYSKISDEAIMRNQNILYEAITTENVDNIIANLMAN